jgi:undecaprenyl-diphosphatase
MGIVEGITEFLPISSTGHLIVAAEIVGFPKKFGSETFEVVIQLGAILAVVYYYRVKILESLKVLKKGQWGFNLWMNVLIAFIPSAIIGLIANDYIEEKLFSVYTVAIAMIVGAVLLFIAQRMYSKNRDEKIEESSIKKSLIIGFCQCLSLIPGMSRSGSTIMGGLIAGYNTKGAAEFSFFLAMPTMIAATAYKLFKGVGDMGGSEWISLSIGFIVSFIVALIVVKKFLEFLANKSMDIFVYYRLVAGVVLLLLLKFGFI